MQVVIARYAEKTEISPLESKSIELYPFTSLTVKSSEPENQKLWKISIFQGSICF